MFLTIVYIVMLLYTSFTYELNAFESMVLVGFLFLLDKERKS